MEQARKTLAELLTYATNNALLKVRTAIPAKLDSYDETTGRAQVSIVIKKVFPDEEQLLIPPQVDVPVLLPRSAGGLSYLQLNLEVGDTGMLVFSDRSIEDWKERGLISDQTNYRTHDISDGVFIPGVYPFNNPINPSDPTDTSLVNDKASVTLKKTGKVGVSGHDGSQFVEIFQQMSELLDTLIAAKVPTSIGPQSFDPATLQKLVATKTLIDGVKI